MIYSSADDSASVTTQIVNSIHEEGVNLKEVIGIMEELSQTAKQLESTVAQFTL